MWTIPKCLVSPGLPLSLVPGISWWEPWATNRPAALLPVQAVGKR